MSTHRLAANLAADVTALPDGEGRGQQPVTSAYGSKDGSGVHDAVVVLKYPKPDGDRLAFDVKVLEGDPGDADGPAAVFIAIIGLPFTPLSFAGVARHTMYRGGPLMQAPQPRLERMHHLTIALPVAGTIPTYLCYRQRTRECGPRKVMRTFNSANAFPIEGVSMVYTFDKANADGASTHKVQFETASKLGIYGDGRGRWR